MSSNEWCEPLMPTTVEGVDVANGQVGALDEETEPRLGLSDDERRWMEREYDVRLPFTSSDALQWLLGAMPKQTFLETIWERKPHLVRHQNPHYLADIMTIDDLHDVLLNATQDHTFAEIVCFKNQVQQPASCPFYAFLSGCSVVLNHADKQSPSINALCQVHPHSDDRDVFLLQIWGSKRWKVYGNPIPLPYTDEQVGKEGRRLEAEEMGPLSLEEEVCAGDVLYIPRGFVHEAEAQTQGSLHITVAVPTQDFTWAKALLDTVKQHLRHSHNQRWRQCVPLRLLPSGPADPAWAEEWPRRLEDLLRDAAAGVSVAGVRGVLANRMRSHKLRQAQALSAEQRGARLVVKRGVALAAKIFPVGDVGYERHQPQRRPEEEEAEGGYVRGRFAS